MTATTHSERLGLALRTLSTDGRLIRSPVWLLALVAGVTVTEARHSLRALDRVGAVYLARLPRSDADDCMVLIRPPWPPR